MSDNGLISFNTAIYWYTPRRFPINNTAYAMLAPYWADSNTELNSGRVYYREVTKNSTNGKHTIIIVRLKRHVNLGKSTLRKF